MPEGFEDPGSDLNSKTEWVTSGPPLGSSSSPTSSHATRTVASATDDSQSAIRH
jgi:hypothetical protein